MTKKKAEAVTKWLDVRCDDYLFATKVGISGCLSSLKVKGEWTVVLAFLITIIGDVLARMKKHHYNVAHELILRALLEFMKGEAPETPKPEELTDKQRKKRAKHNEAILESLEAVL